jgi:hypothetical protein
VDTTVEQIFTIENGAIVLYEIGETETIQEMIEQTKAANRLARPTLHKR